MPAAVSVTVLSSFCFFPLFPPSCGARQPLCADITYHMCYCRADFLGNEREERLSHHFGGRQPVHSQT